MDRNFSDVGYLAMKTVMAMIDGQAQPSETFNHMRESLAGTCGCCRDEQAEVIRIKDRFFRQTQFLRRFYLTQDKFSTAAFAAGEPEDVMSALEKHRAIFGEGDFRIYLDEDYYNNMMSEGESARELEDGQFSRRFVLAADSQKPVAWDGNHQRVSAGGTQLREPEGDSQSSRMTIYYPLSFGNIMIGVLMLNGLSASAEMNLHESIINMIVFSLENIRQRKILNRLNRKLNNLYVTDQLTGLNNRFGIDRFGQPLFDRLREEGQEIRFLFLDIDDMKGINDRYGHETGDTAIRTAADILRKLCRPGDFMMRYGGDEFIAIGPVDSRDPEQLAREELRRVEKSLPCPLGISVGTYIRKPDSTLGLDGCLKEADARMYEIKNLKKKEESAKAGGEEGSV
jgi:diguanylate cyclase (GGDEF)-like protein